MLVLFLVRCYLLKNFYHECRNSWLDGCHGTARCFDFFSTSGYFSDLVGRKKALLFAFCFILGTLICSFTPDVTWLITGRIIIGLAIGVALVYPLLYLN